MLRSCQNEVLTRNQYILRQQPGMVKGKVCLSAVMPILTVRTLREFGKDNVLK